MYLSGVLERQPRTPYAGEFTYCSEDRNAQPLRLYLIEGFNVSKVSHKCPKSSFHEESWLDKFEDIYSIDQAFQVYTVIRKCEAVQDCLLVKQIFATKRNHLQTWTERTPSNPEFRRPVSN